MATDIDSVVEDFIHNDKVPSRKPPPFMQEEINVETLSVADFYQGQNVLITGATGFLGGLLLEKLLRSCPGINTIYLLIRENKKTGQDAENRLKKLLSSPIFSSTSETNKAKVVAVPADVSLPGLGLSASNCQVLRDKVSIVFHVAATLNFNSPLPSAIDTNLLGTRRVLNLSHLMRNIKAMVYVSTAYCNCTQRSIVAEQIYPTIHDPDLLIASLSKLSPSEIAMVTPKILSGHPNTYSFTKLLAENLILKERGSVPVAIVRPSIVLGTLKEPIAGWVDSVHNGAFAFIAGAGKGVFRTILADGKKVADMVPCDMVVNHLIASASHIAYSDEGIKVYHMTSGTKNPIQWNQYADLTVAAIHRNPCLYPVWYPGAKCRTNLLWAAYKLLVAHFIPAILLYMYDKLQGKPHRLLEIQNKYVRGMLLSKYFTTHEWQFNMSNTEALMGSMSESDREKFHFDITNVHWPEYIEICAVGVKRFFHKEASKTDHIARKHRNRSWWVDMAAKIIIFLVLFVCFNGILGNVASLMTSLILTYILFDA